MTKGKKLAVLGAGKMGETLISGMLDGEIVPSKNIVATAKHAERLDLLREKYRIATTLNNRKAVRGADTVLLAVKPQVVRELLEEIRGELVREQVVVSVVASVTTAFIERNLNAPIPVVRAMPNTPCLLRAGMTAICKGIYADGEHLKETQRMFDSVGRTLVLDEKHMDAVTGLSASGPAFMYIIIESLAEAGVKVGLPRAVATELAAQMTQGAARMVLETKEHPALFEGYCHDPRRLYD
jgi:pyrroline-5-carboxylate reductase